MVTFTEVKVHDPWKMYGRALVCSECGAVVVGSKTADHEAHHEAIEEMLTALRVYGQALGLGLVPAERATVDSVDRDGL